MSKYDPDPALPYSYCTKCDGHPKFQTEELTREHMHANHGHSMRITNPSRTDRIECDVNNEIEYALNQAFDDIYQNVESGDMTLEEATAAIRMSTDVVTEWEQYAEDVSA